jgi:hypothetical protein
LLTPVRWAFTIAIDKFFSWRYGESTMPRRLSSPLNIQLGGRMALRQALAPDG